MNIQIELTLAPWSKNYVSTTDAGLSLAPVEVQTWIQELLGLTE